MFLLPVLLDRVPGIGLRNAMNRAVFFAAFLRHTNPVPGPRKVTRWSLLMLPSVLRSSRRASTGRAKKPSTTGLDFVASLPDTERKAGQ
jgi:hypothetical protein